MGSITPDSSPSFLADKKSVSPLKSSPRNYTWVSSTGVSDYVARIWDRFLSFLYNALSITRPLPGLSENLLPQNSDDTHHGFVTAVAMASMPSPHKPIPKDLSTEGINSFYTVNNEADTKGETVIMDERLKTVAAPTDRGLLLLAAHYEHKYGIKMVVVSSQEGLAEALRGGGFTIYVP